MEDLIIAILSVGLLFFSLFSKTLEKIGITPAMTFCTIGLCVSLSTAATETLTAVNPFLRIIATISLILILFTDAIDINLEHLRHNYYPLKLLFIALPLTIVFGSAVAFVLFPSFSLAMAAVLAILLAPTDAALGQSILTCP